MILNSELAGKPIGLILKRAENAIRDVEKISREALAEGAMPSAVIAPKGSRKNSFAAISDSEDSECAAESQEGLRVPLSPAQERCWVLAVRESVTNVVRHTRAGDAT